MNEVKSQFHTNLITVSFLEGSMTLQSPVWLLITFSYLKELLHTEQACIQNATNTASLRSPTQAKRRRIKCGKQGSIPLYDFNFISVLHCIHTLCSQQKEST